MKVAYYTILYGTCKQTWRLHGLSGKAHFISKRGLYFPGKNTQIKWIMYIIK